MNHKQMYDICKRNMYRYVLVQTSDQNYYDGIIENVDDQSLYLAVPTGGELERNEGMDERLVAPFVWGPGFGYPWYGYPSYGFYGPPRRFSRLVLPLAAITALSLLPYY